MLPRLPDLVADAHLETKFLSESHTVHFYTESGHEPGERTVDRQEHWSRQKRINRGAYGEVFLEKCVKGKREYELRATKRIDVNKTPIDISEYTRELEAIAKFSHRRVSSRSYGTNTFRGHDALII